MEPSKDLKESRNLQRPSKIKFNCWDCDAVFITECVFLTDRPLPLNRHCESCSRKIAEEKERQLLEQQRRDEDARRKRFESEVPSLYQNTPSDLIDPILLDAVNSWVYSPKGLGMVGETGLGKTSAQVRLQAKQSKKGKSICFLEATELAELASAANQYNDESKKKQAEQRLHKAKTSDITLLDDLGKGKLTERGESSLYELLNYRYSHQLPMFWTSNSTAEEMLKSFSDDRGMAIIRRLTATSVVISQRTVGQ